MWKRSVVCQVLDSSSNHINVHIMDGINISWNLTCFYGFLERTRRQDSRDFLRSLAMLTFPSASSGISMICYMLMIIRVLILTLPLF